MEAGDPTRPQGGAALVSGLGGPAGFGEGVLGRNDDGSTPALDVTPIFEDGLDFYGRVFTALWINNNGSVTFDGPRAAYTPDRINGRGDSPEITPFFADVDTRNPGAVATPGGNSTGSNLVHYDLDRAGDRVVVTWDDVGYYLNRVDRLNAFQLILSDRGAGDFDIEFRYEAVNWTTGDYSDGRGGLGGTVARAGYSAGGAGVYYELPASGDQDAILALDAVPGNTGDVGRWLFAVRAGDVARAGVPALPEGGFGGWTVGDLHLRTFDGVGYGFQAAGEFVMARSAAGPGFELQARFSPIATSTLVTVTSAVALRLSDGTALEIDARADAPLLVGGVPREIPNFGSIAVGPDRVFREDNVVTIVFAGGDGVVGAGDGRVIVDVIGDRLDVDLRLGGGLAGRLEGLLGDGDGDPANDVARADGTPLARPFDFAELYGGFRDDWRVAEASDSLFTYAPGGGPDDAYLPDFPAGPITFADLPDTLRAAATRAATEAGLTPGTANFENAALDFALTGDRSYLGSGLGVPALPGDAAVGLDPGSAEGLEPPRATIAGGAGRDRLEGTAASEALDGRGGRDVLIGGGGGDVMTGGADGDSFVLVRDQAPVRIADWGTGGDRLALDDGMLGLGGDDVDIRAADPSEAQGVLAEGRVAYDAATGLLAIDADGAGGPAGLRPVAVIEGGGALAISDVLLF